MDRIEDVEAQRVGGKPDDQNAVPIEGGEGGLANRSFQRSATGRAIRRLLGCPTATDAGDPQGWQAADAGLRHDLAACAKNALQALPGGLRACRDESAPPHRISKPLDIES